MPSKRITLVITCARCQRQFEHTDWPSQQFPKFCSRTCRVRLLPGETRIEQQARYRSEARAFVAAIRAKTVCAHCGAQPIDWHNPEHVEQNRQNYRISRMVGIGRSLEAIEAEMARCTPLCRRCHMTEDGRLRALLENAPKHPPLPLTCIECSRPTMRPRRSLCGTCYSRHQRNGGWQREQTNSQRENAIRAARRHCQEANTCA